MVSPSSEQTRTSPPYDHPALEELSLPQQRQPERSENYFQGSLQDPKLGGLSAGGACGRWRLKCSLGVQYVIVQEINVEQILPSTFVSLGKECSP